MKVNEATASDVALPQHESQLTDPGAGLPPKLTRESDQAQADRLDLYRDYVELIVRFAPTKDSGPKLLKSLVPKPDPTDSSEQPLDEELDEEPEKRVARELSIFKHIEVSLDREDREDPDHHRYQKY